MSASVLILNGSPSGKNGNCSQLIQIISTQFKRHPDLKKLKSEVIHLSQIKWTLSDRKKLKTKMNQAKGVFFVTGTYWDSWGSPLQLFLENMTELEGRKEILGKPAVVCVLNHSVGGKGILSRLQGVLSTLGFLIPPMSGFLYSWVNQQAVSQKRSRKLKNDLWSLDDLTPIIANFYESLKLKANWQSWPVDRKNYRQIWIK